MLTIRRASAVFQSTSFTLARPWRPKIAFASAMAVAAMLAAGCQTAQHPSAAQSHRDSVLAHRQNPTTYPSDRTASNGSAPTEEPSNQASTAEAIARRAQSYAHDLSPLLENKNPPIPTQPPPAAAEPSGVEFTPPQGAGQGGILGTILAKRSEGAPVADRTIPLARPVIDATPSTPNAQVSSLNIPTRAPSGLDTLDPNASANSVPSRYSPATSDALEARIAQRVHDYPKDVWAHFDFQLMQFLLDQPVPQMTVLSELPSEDRELLTAVVDGLSNFRGALRADNNMLPSKKVRPILELADRLRAQADLAIPTMALCTRIDGFGVYEPIDPLRFAAGKEHQALIYCEVENFASQIDEKKMWETKLSQEASLFTETGMLVWQDNGKPMVDLSRNRRHDFYIVKRIKLPANLTIGRYLLKVTVVDQQANRVAEATLPIQIVAQP